LLSSSKVLLLRFRIKYAGNLIPFFFEIEIAEII